MFRLTANNVAAVRRAAAVRPATLRAAANLRMASTVAKPSDPAFVDNPEEAKEFVQNEDNIIEHSKKGASTWLKVTLFVALPAIVITGAYVYKVEAAHAEHRAHNKDIPDDEWPKQYPYMNNRSKDFFWGDGDKTLFWNKDVNRHVK